MDAADPRSVTRDDEPGVLGRLPPTRPQHRSARRRGAAASRPAATATSAAPALPPTGRGTPPAAGPAPKRALDVPAPPPAPRSGWATPEPDRGPSTPLPPLVALADGAVRVGGRLLLGVLRRLPGL